MDSTVFTHDRGRTQHFLKIHGVHVFFLIRDEVHIDSWGMGSTAFTYERWPFQVFTQKRLNPQHTEYTAFTHERRNTRHVLMREGVNKVYS